MEKTKFEAVHQQLIDNCERVKNYDFSHLDSTKTTKLKGSKMMVKKEVLTENTMTFNL